MLYHLFTNLSSNVGAFNVFRYITFRTGAATLTAIFLSFLIGPPLIRFLMRLRVDQPFQKDGPDHHAKAGTPTMGGLMILFSVVVSVLLWSDLTNRWVWIVLGVTAGYGCLGLVDDYKKVKQRDNAGITAGQKLVWQFTLAIAVAIAIFYDPSFDGELTVPFFKNFTPHLGLLYIPLATFIIVGASNSVNLTDGLDGLAIGPTMIVAGTFILLAYASGHARIAEYLAIKSVTGAGELTIFCGALVGGSLGFLWYNTFPAAVFMGDVGSLSLGGALGTIAVIIRQEVLLALVGGIFVIEALSVIMQVSSFKLTGKRIFLMAPIHHHFATDCRSVLDHFHYFGAFCAVFVEVEMMNELAGKHVLVLGLGRSGRSAAKFCAQHGAYVVAADEAPLACEALQNLEANLKVCVGQPFPDPAAFDLVVPSPGVPRERYAAHAKQVWGDIEIAFRSFDTPMIAVTGSNGKSTTTLLIEAMLCRAGIRALAAGNIGTPILDLGEEKLDQFVLEVSSFQLETVETFRPAIAVLLNFSPDHIDRHGSIEAYFAVKARIFSNQLASDLLIANASDEAIVRMLRKARSRVWTFHPSEPQTQGAWYEGDSVVLKLGDQTKRFPFSLGTLQGTHNRQNALASLLAAVAAGARAEDALDALQHFKGLPHRTQLVGLHNGVRYIDDSKATNVGAAVTALQSFDTPIVWIAGGRDKGLDYHPLADAARGRVRAALFLGEAAPQLDAVLPAQIPRTNVSSMEDAVREAARCAQSGDVVLLAPACASFDQFRDYKERGEVFQRAVSKLSNPCEESRSS